MDIQKSTKGAFCLGLAHYVHHAIPFTQTRFLGITTNKNTIIEDGAIWSLWSSAGDCNHGNPELHSSYESGCYTSNASEGNKHIINNYRLPQQGDSGKKLYQRLVCGECLIKGVILGHQV